ncbi:WbqC family protein [Acetobacterium sp.]|uniref:WbqC family protein n=1 Tax=Acetobacterium sp. TaxID=1872094 RepID=UPI002727C2F7|nr:WbqC family protein [Acetobacterium sp.]MDO9491613.1 WbqC family protein [Acetobacterium sp.]
MDISIMQPYLFPYIGYYQMINCSDYFVIADDVQFIKKGWINRNRILLNGEPSMITLPLNRDSTYLKIYERSFENQAGSKRRITFLNKIVNSYRKAPEFTNIYPLIEKIMRFENYNVAEYLHNSIKEICFYLDIKTEIIVESSLNLSPEMEYQESVIYVCKELKADRYINLIGGMDLYSAKKFKNNNILLKFIKTRETLKYRQYNNKFVPNLSIIDVMMFNSRKEIKALLTEYDLIDGRD